METYIFMEEKGVTLPEVREGYKEDMEYLTRVYQDFNDEYQSSASSSSSCDEGSSFCEGESADVDNFYDFEFEFRELQRKFNDVVAREKQFAYEKIDQFSRQSLEYRKKNLKRINEEIKNPFRKLASFKNKGDRRTNIDFWNNDIEDVLDTWEKVKRQLEFEEERENRDKRRKVETQK